MPQGLERDCPRLIVVITAESQRMMRTAHRQHRSPRREALVEDIDLGARVAAKLERQQREQDRLAGAGRADDQHMADIADMGAEPERRRAAGLGVEQRRTVEMGIADRPCPDRRQRHQVGEVERMDDRLADIGVDMAGQRAEPGFDRVYALADGGEAETVDDALDRADLFIRPGAIRVRHGDRRRKVAEGNVIAAERLEREIGIDHLVVGIAVEQLDRLVVDDLAQHRGDRLALVEPLAAHLGQRLGRVGLG